ncbi:hypothetical protein CHA01nite_36230 [Chryseobacterium hagamense]|uniref:Uncharacterized protein n=2 Tax=Chryseobacterium hagamense TaxID=395935 RepID=A0A511YRR4_9FLAO|nr:hypothetical protein CHA01nite_36230 [Chryseobacterium hagamense]
MFDEHRNEVGRIVDASKIFSLRHYIIYNARSYDIRNVGFMKNDVELFNARGVIYFTDLAKERIIKSGEKVRIYNFALRKTNQLYEKGRLLIEIREEKKWFKDPVFHIEADESTHDLLVLTFLYYSTKEFNGIGGDGD